MVRINTLLDIDVDTINSVEKIGGTGELETSLISTALTNTVFIAMEYGIRELPTKDVQDRSTFLSTSGSK